MVEVKKTRQKLNKSIDIESLNLNPSSFFPFQNAVLSDEKYIVVKNLTKQGNW